MLFHAVQQASATPGRLCYAQAGRDVTAGRERPEGRTDGHRGQQGGQGYSRVPATGRRPAQDGRSAAGHKETTAQPCGLARGTSFKTSKTFYQFTFLRLFR